MTQLQNLTNYADQKINLTLPGGAAATLEFVYSASCQRWWLNASYGATTINGIGLCTLPNMLRQWMNIFPFGLGVSVADETDPFDINDLIPTQQYPDARVTLFFLNAQDVASVEKTVFGSAVQI